MKWKSVEVADDSVDSTSSKVADAFTSTDAMKTVYSHIRRGNRHLCCHLCSNACKSRFSFDASFFLDGSVVERCGCLCPDFTMGRV